MQPLQYDLRKSNSILHAAAAARNLAAAITMRFAAPRLKPACIYAHGNENSNNHAAIPLRSATTDSKTPYNDAHTNASKAAATHRYSAGTKKTSN